MDAENSGQLARSDFSKLFFFENSKGLLFVGVEGVAPLDSGTEGVEPREDVGEESLEQVLVSKDASDDVSLVAALVGRDWSRWRIEGFATWTGCSGRSQPAAGTSATFLMMLFSIKSALDDRSQPLASKCYQTASGAALA